MYTSPASYQATRWRIDYNSDEYQLPVMKKLCELLPIDAKQCSMVLPQADRYRIFRVKIIESKF